MSSAKREREEISIDTETQVPQAKRQKTVEEEEEKIKERVLEKLKLREIVNLLNKRTRRGVEKFVCSDCNDLCIGEPHTFTMFGGQQQSYCDDCTRECEGCGDLYCEELVYEHEGCVEEEEEEELEEVMNPDGTIKLIPLNEVAVE